MKDISKMTMAELKELQVAVGQQMASARKVAIEQAQAAVCKLLEESGLSRTEVLAPLLRPRPPSGLAVIPSARYRNPDNPTQVWLGKGKRPAWLLALVEEGRRLEELRME